MKALYALLIGCGLLLLANAAHGSPASTDPSVIINRCSTCDALTFSTNSLLDPLTIDLVDGLFPPDAFQYTGTATLFDFYVLIEGALPGETFSCSSDIFTGPCYNLPPTGNILGYDLVIFTSQSGDTGLAAGENITAAVSTPEPSLMLQLLLGLLFVVSLRWWRFRSIEPALPGALPQTKV